MQQKDKNSAIRNKTKQIEKQTNKQTKKNNQNKDKKFMDGFLCTQVL